MVEPHNVVEPARCERTSFAQGDQRLSQGPRLGRSQTKTAASWTCWHADGDFRGLPIQDASEEADRPSEVEGLQESNIVAV